MADLFPAVAALQKEILLLKLQHDRLAEEIQFLRSHQTLQAGIAGEVMIAKLINGKRTARGSPHDIERGNIKLEIKFANLNKTGAPSGNYTRWAWGKIFGEGGNKQYDYLVLVGVKDPRWKDHYRDRNSPYVFFCIPHEEVESLTQPMNGGLYRAVQLPSNPRRVRRSRAARLFSEFERSYEELQEMFGL